MLINILLLILSIGIYASFGISNLIYILFSTVTTYAAARIIANKRVTKGGEPYNVNYTDKENKNAEIIKEVKDENSKNNQNKKNGKWILIITIAVNTCILIAIKILLYGQAKLNWLSGVQIIAPLGISYYTLQVISYIVDVYKGKIEAEKNFFKYVLYVMYFPYLFIGPITRYEDMKNELFKNKRIKPENIYNGTIRILWGLTKKIVIAGRVGILIGTIASDVSAYKGAYALLAMLLYSVQLYADFSGGIDIVIGGSKMLGINLKENFDSPYLSQSIKEFWRRWHIALSSWLKDYIYIPLGGNRCGKIRNKINIIITFVISGFWHGMNYLLWGLLHGLLVVYGKILKTKWKPLNIIITFLLVSILWSFFIWPDTLTSLQMIGSIFTNFNYAQMFTNLLNLGLNLANIIVLIISVIVLIIFDIKKEKIISKIKSYKLEGKLAIIGTLAILVLVFGIYGIGFNVSEFIYSKF